MSIRKYKVIKNLETNQYCTGDSEIKWSRNINDALHLEGDFDPVFPNWNHQVIEDLTLLEDYALIDVFRKYPKQ